MTTEKTEKEETLFERLSKIDVSEYTEKKGGLTYLSWAHAWRIFKRECPDAEYDIIRNDEGLLYYYDEKTGYMCGTEVTVEGETHEMWLPVMDYKNKALKGEDASMFDINKTIMRCLVKNLAMFGLGIYIYAGEDLPEAPKVEPKTPAQKYAKQAQGWNDAKLKWFEIEWLWGEKKGKTLGALAAENDTASLQKLLDYTKECCDEKAVEFLLRQLDQAVAESNTQTK